MIQPAHGYFLTVLFKQSSKCQKLYLRPRESTESIFKET